MEHLTVCKNTVKYMASFEHQNPTLWGSGDKYYKYPLQAYFYKKKDKYPFTTKEIDSKIPSRLPPPPQPRGVHAALVSGQARTRTQTFSPWSSDKLPLTVLRQAFQYVVYLSSGNLFKSLSKVLALSISTHPLRNKFSKSCLQVFLFSNHL